MKFRETIYPYNFNFENEVVLTHWHITRFLNELESKNLFTLNFSDGQLLLEFNGVFRGLGFQKFYFERVNAAASQRTLRELSRGLSRYQKVHKGELRPSLSFYVNILKNEDRDSEVIDILTKFTGLVMELKNSGVIYLEDLNKGNIKLNYYVSPLLLSYWIERWEKFNGSTLDNGFWEAVTYDGNIRSLEQKLVEARNYWPRFPSINGLEIYFPQEKYVLIQDATQTIDFQLRFTNYKIYFFDQSILSNSRALQSYVNGRHLSLIHIIPHYLIYHVHSFATAEDLTHYLEWSIYRSQRELSAYTSSVTYTSGLRFTRGCFIGFGASEYQKFLNFVLWNTVHFNFPSNNADYLQWRSILLKAFSEFKNQYPNYCYTIDEMYPAPKMQREYIMNLFNIFEVINEQAERLLFLLRNYLDVTYDCELPEPSLQELGRVEMHRQKNVPVTFSELPDEREFKSSVLPLMRFMQTRIQSDHYQNQRISIRRNLIGGILIPRYIRSNSPKVKVKELLLQINSIRKSEHIRVLFKKLTPINLQNAFVKLSDMLLEDTEMTVSFWFGLLLHFTNGKALIESISSDNRENPVTYGLECTLKKSMIHDRIINVNASTPKLLSVLDTLFHYLSVENHERSAVNLATMKDLLSKVLILGAVDDGDPLGDIFKFYFQSRVSQVGGFGVGKVIRAEVSHFEFNVSYTAIISDIDLGLIKNQEDINQFLSNVVIKYMQNIEPALGIFKVNYGSYLMMQYILNYLHTEFIYFYDYQITFITPQFGKAGNYEKYLTFNKRNNNRWKGYILQLERNETTLVVNQNELPLVESQCKDAEDFNHLLRLDFPRMYYFVVSNTNELRDVSTVLSHRSDRVIVSRSFGSDSISYYAMLNPSRVRLCLRISTLLELTSQLSERFDVNYLPNSEFTFQREERILSLGNFYRELSRIQILVDDQGEDVISSLSNFVYTENNFHYVGIGDERARNIICVPTMSPYTIYDKKSYPQLSAFEIICVDEYFDFDNEDAIASLIRREYTRYQKKLKFFFLFMLFNKVRTKEEIKHRVNVLAKMMNSYKDLIECVYFNVYIEFFGLPSPEHLVTNHPYTLYNDIIIDGRIRDEELHFFGTFSNNYELVELLTYDDVQSIADDNGVELLNLPLHTNYIAFTLWNLGLSVSSFDMNGITIASEFCPVLKFY
nr:MAG: VP4 [Reoviridae sp.]